MEECGAAMIRYRLIGELNQGIELTKVLETHLDYAAPFEFQRLLIRSLLSTLVRAVSAAAALPAAPQPPRENHGGDAHSRVSKKRKVTEPELTRWVRVTSAADGFSWRKYGQKGILESKYPRAYYRCSHYKTRGCPATKQMQKSDEDHFDVVYRGAHTCGVEGEVSAAAGEAAPPVTRAERENSLRGPNSKPIILDFGSGRATKEDLDDHDLPSTSVPAKNIAGPVDPNEPIFDMVNGQYFLDDFDLDFMGDDSFSWS